MKNKKLSGRIRPRNIRRAQIAKMKQRWPDFEMKQSKEGTIIWRGRLRGFQRFYVVGIIWNLREMNRPYVLLIDPPLTPHQGTDFENIPHLIYHSDDPVRSGLCLYDPDGGEWSESMLIADTTIPWAAQWLYYYELWHYDGKWRGGGVGPESVAQARTKAVYGETQEYPSHPKKEAPVAIKPTLQNSIS